MTKVKELILHLMSLLFMSRRNLRYWAGKRRNLIIMLGNKRLLEKRIREQDICEEIKRILHEEIIKEEISRRDIERYCPDNWKKRTKPKQKENENDNPSFIDPPIQTEPIVIDNEGQVIHSDSSTIVVDSIDSTRSDRKYGDSVEDHNKNGHNANNDRIQFEFPFDYLQLQSYMAKEFQSHNGTKKVWVHFTMCKQTG